MPTVPRRRAQPPASFSGAEPGCQGPAADAEQLAAEIGDLSRAYLADGPARVADLERQERRMAEQAIEMEVTAVTVPDFPPCT